MRERLQILQGLKQEMEACKDGEGKSSKKKIITGRIRIKLIYFECVCSLSIECSKHFAWIGLCKTTESRVTEVKGRNCSIWMKPTVELNTTKTLIMIETAVCLLYLV